MAYRQRLIEQDAIISFRLQIDRIYADKKNGGGGRAREEAKTFVSDYFHILIDQISHTVQQFPHYPCVSAQFCTSIFKYAKPVTLENRQNQFD